MPKSHSSKTAVYAALLGNFLIALTKAAAAFWTGSSAMMSEAVHSAVDTSNELLLLYGIHRAQLPADERHPLGHGGELYFWSFLVALLLFALGSGVSMYEGIVRAINPEPIRDVRVAYIVLALSFLFEGTSLWIAWRGFRGSTRGLGYFEAFRKSKDPPAFMVVLEDSAALVGIAIAAIATATSALLDQPVWDGVGSIFIGVLLGITAGFLAKECKSLLLGEPADHELTKSILRAASNSPAVLQAGSLMTMQLSPTEVVAVLSVEFADDKRADDIEQAVVDIETAVRSQHPTVAAIFIKPQTRARFRATRGALEG